MEHTYLFRPGRWQASGSYRDAAGQTCAADGWAEMRHESDLWELVGSLRLLGPEPVEFTNRYLITPPGSPAEGIVWRSHNPALGEMSGLFCVVEDAILVTGAPLDGAHRVVECLIRRDPNRYRTRGVLTRGDAVLGSWAMELTRGDSPGTP